MSRVVRISDRTFAKLERFVQGFEDTPDSVIERLVDEVLGGDHNSPERHDQQVILTNGPRRLDSTNPPNLAFSRLRQASMNGGDVSKPKWNLLLRHVHELGLRRLGSFEALQRATTAHIQKGRFEESGFTYIPDGNFSIQGVDANLAWEHTIHLAEEIGVTVQVELQWMNRPKAAHPGARATMEFSPTAMSERNT